MRIEQLEYVAAVARSGSFRRAAELLHISQPALSETVRNLERELGVEILDRAATGARISEEGGELLPHMLDVLEAVDRLRRAANHEHQVSRMVRVGTVSAATSPLLAPAVRQFRKLHPETHVEVRSLQQDEIHRGITDGTLDLGLVNYLDGENIERELDTTLLVRGRAVVCMRADSALASKDSVARRDLVGEPLVMMRAGYAMHRYVRRLLGEIEPTCAHAADGAEMGKLMVAEGLGVTVLPSYSVIGDPLERNGTITYREITDDDTSVLLVLQRRRSAAAPRSVRELHGALVEHGQALEHCSQSLLRL